MSYSIEWRDSYDAHNRFENRRQKTFRNKDEIINALILEIQSITGDDVKVLFKGKWKY